MAATGLSTGTQRTTQQHPPAKTFHRFYNFPPELRCMV
ncbi:predicted protein [Sclerotinia sclerotiorum 1980 UF-70]|uniref:Uncharacterized protein n=1 Tax=Sclerotinia sclerotiorum (strain ATCC 18683 / 1980 / Ss-1) TaxID=665079 RepID=A7EZI3_SCLS1|nr:predicted protein [Sclerotinia sclerotiorum 1980 UF-70]EDN94875.1 predicted protein [Sclerotinia sclerotiorum 1980 UF-70]